MTYPIEITKNFSITDMCALHTNEKQIAGNEPVVINFDFFGQFAHVTFRGNDGVTFADADTDLFDSFESQLDDHSDKILEAYLDFLKEENG